jgi:hypothetical protein
MLIIPYFFQLATDRAVWSRIKGLRPRRPWKTVKKLDFTAVLYWKVGRRNRDRLEFLRFLMA